jgi:excinuclease ABC subunit A
MNDENIPDVYTGSYEGIIPMLKRWFTSSQSTDVLKGWVEKYMRLSECPVCKGARLKKESLWFKVGEKNISELSDMNLDKLMRWFGSAEDKLSNKQNLIAKDVLKEIRERLQFFGCRPHLSFAQSSFENIERG